VSDLTLPWWAIVVGMVLGPGGAVAATVTVLRARAQMRQINASLESDRATRALDEKRFRLEVERMQLDERQKFTEQLQSELKDVRAALAECNAGRHSDLERIRQLDQRHYDLLKQLNALEVAHALATPAPQQVAPQQTVTVQATTPEGGS
jgi:septal ring factor EnvC (AmiA/AmiB activator)